MRPGHPDAPEFVRIRRGILSDSRLTPQAKVVITLADITPAADMGELVERICVDLAILPQEVKKWLKVGGDLGWLNLATKGIVERERVFTPHAQQIFAEEVAGQRLVAPEKVVLGLIDDAIEAGYDEHTIRRACRLAHGWARNTWDYALSHAERGVKVA